MFYGCTSLTTAPLKLPSTTLKHSCYEAMFQGCTNLNYVKALFIRVPLGGVPQYLDYWLKGVAKTGTFVKNNNTEWYGQYGIVPSGWTIINE